MRILFLSQLYPYPPVCGGTIKSWNILKHLAEQHDVTLVSLVRGVGRINGSDGPSCVCRAVYGVPIRRSGLLNVKFAISSILRRESFIITRDFVLEMQRIVDELVEQESFDLIYVDHLQMAQYVRPGQAVRLILDEHNVEWRIIKRIADASRGPKRLLAELEYRKLREHEISACKCFDSVLTVTDEDRCALKSDSSGHDNFVTVPIGVDLGEFLPVKLSTESKIIISIATMSWPPNIDSILYFAKEIYPLVKELIPDAGFIIAGSKPPESISNLSRQDPSIIVTGYVPDIKKMAEKAAIMVVPLRSGSGMRVKVINALAMGLPIVSTTIGCEGIGVVDGRDIVIADQTAGFASAVAWLLNNPNERMKLAENGRRFVELNYAWESIYPRLDTVIESAIGAGWG